MASEKCMIVGGEWDQYWRNQFPSEAEELFATETETNWSEIAKQ